MKLSRSSLLLASTFALALAAATAPASEKSPARGINRTRFEHWPDALQLESKESAAKAVVVPAFGGRVMSYGLHGENILWVNPDASAAVPATPTNTLVPAGFFCTLGPDSPARPGNGAMANGTYEWTTRSHALLVLRSPEEKGARASLEREMMFDPSTGDLGFVHRVKNLTEDDAAFTLCQRIACKPGGFVLVPVNKKSRFAAGWSVKRDAAGASPWDGATPQAEGVRLLDGLLVARTGTGSARVGTDSDAQWMAYVIGRSLFIINFPYYASAVYAEGGNSVTFSWNDKMTELEPIGPEARLRSRKTADLPMKWSLVELPAEVTSFEQARALADKVPASPFQ